MGNLCYYTGVFMSLHLQSTESTASTSWHLPSRIGQAASDSPAEMLAQPTDPVLVMAAFGPFQLITDVFL